MTRTVLWAIAISTGAALIQSTILSRLSILNTVPDLKLGVLVYVSYVNGVMTGQTLGFSSGILLDFISAAPLGYNAFVRTIIGALTGLLKGTFFLDILVLPMALCASATITKAFIAWIVSILFAGTVPHYSLASPILWTEMAYNVVTAPFLFAFLNLFKSVLRPRKDN
ncbi:MAG: rod shape-determining protein MreD [Treponemataceae bacterium]